jgi:hypothetical protein
VPALPANAIVFRDGLPVAVEEGRRVTPRPDAGESAGSVEALAGA